MDGNAGAPKDPVYLLEFGFKWNGQALHAGRGPLYGTEAPLDDMHPGSEPRRTEVYDLSPFPIRYPELLQADNAPISLEFEPSQPIQKGTMNIRIGWVSSSEALGLWFEKGVGISRADIGEWAEKLAGPKPETMEFEIRKRTRTFKETGAVMEESSLGRYKLAPGLPTEVSLEIPELQASEERYEIVFPDYRFSWERRKSQSPLEWLKGGPAPTSSATQMNGTDPVEAKSGPDKPPQSKTSKPPFWQFWKKGE